VLGGGLRARGHTAQDIERAVMVTQGAIRSLHQREISLDSALGEVCLLYHLRKKNRILAKKLHIIID